MVEADEERLWIQRAIEGDAEAVGFLYRRYAPMIFRYLCYRLGDQDSAEDLTAEVFLRVLEALPRYRQRGRPFSAWLYQIAGARAADHFRWHRRRATLRLRPELARTTEGPEQEAESHLTAEELQRALAQLTPAQQQVVVLRFVERMTHAETAHILRRSEGAVRVLQYRALAALRRLLEKE